MAATSSGFESFPTLFNDSDGEETIGSKIKRFFLPTGPSHSSASSATGSATPSTTTATPAAAPSPATHAPPAPAPTSPVPIEPLPAATKNRQHSRNNSATQQQLAQLAAVGAPSRPSQSTSPPTFPSVSDPAQPSPSYPIRPNGRKVVRPIRLSGVSPSVRVTVANSERGDLIQSASSRSIYGDSRYGSDIVVTPGGGMHGSPTANDGFGAALANLSSIPGFPLGREGGDDTKSVRSMSTVAKPSPSAAHVFRKLRGEGLSTDYWIKDESSKECFDCQMLFTAFRRKHHCRICGQIFCSRCASNIISSARFGQQGFVRVCNLCLSVLEHGGTSPEENTAPRFRSNLRDSPLTISAPLEASARPPQSQFAASHLFPRSETPYNFPTSEAEFGRISEGSSRGGTPFSEDDEVSSPKRSLEFSRRPSTSPPVAVAPFRRELAEDDSTERAPDELGITAGEKDEDHSDEEGRLLEARLEGPPPSLASGGSGGDEAAPILLGPSPIEQVLSSSASILGKSPPPPVSSSLPHLDTSDSLPSAKPSPALPSSERALSRLSTYTSEPGGSSAFIFQDLPLNGADLERILAESGPYAGHADANPSREVLPISPPALRHIRKMLQQAIAREGLAHRKTWEKVLFQLLLRVGAEILPDLRSGDSIDVREYVRIKKVPGGHPRDSEYVDGVVFTKNLLHKQMERHLPSPRVMLVSFPLEYQRVENQLMSLEPVIKQEKEYLHNLVHRIAAQRPHVVLAERNVSRLALEYLLDHNIAVARNVKREAIEAVARATQADVISSMDKLALEPKLGRCGTFRVQTFAHSLIPGGRKTFMRFEGCPKSFGCTLLLRGGSMAVLAKVKKIVEMMTLVAYNAKLEEYFFRDEIVCPRPGVEEEQERASTSVDVDPALLTNFAEQDRDRISKDIAQALRPYETTLLSGSALVRIPPPYPLFRMSEEDRRIVALRRLREYEETEQILQEEAISRQIISASSSSTSLRSISSERAPPSTAPSTAGTEAYAKPLEDPLKVLQTPQDVARLTEVADAEERHTEQLVTWDAYLATNKDSLDPLDHQRIYFLDSLLCTQTARLCSPPTIRSIDFYGDTDESVGQWVERICRDAGKACPNANCGRHNLAHSRQIVHGHLRLTLVPEVHRVNLDRPELEGQIVLFAYCKKCQKRTGQMAMSDEMYRLSFGKYLELTFCGRLLRADGLCDHDAHTDHIRYWMHSGISMRIVPEHIDLRNVVAPPRVLKIRPEKQLILRNDEYRTVLQKSNAFWDSIVHRIQAFNYDLVQADRLEECRQAMAELSTKCESDRRAITRLLESTYEHAQATNGIEMTSVRRTLQNKAVDWEAEWTSFEQRIIPSEKDVRRLTTVQLKRLFSNDGMPLSPERRTTSSSLAPSIEADEKEGECSGEKAQCEDDGILSLASQSTYDGMTSFSTCLDLQPPTPTLPPPAPSSPVGEPSTISSTDNESDSTVCADHPTLDANTKSRLPSPYVVRRHRPRADDTSGADSELEVRAPPIRRGRSSHGGVAHLVNFFSENPESSTGEGRAPSGSSKGSVSRPSLKRGVTEGKLRPKSRVNSKDVFSDGEGNSYARNVGVSHLFTQNQQNFAERPSRIPARKTISKAGDLARVFDPPTEGERRRTPAPSQPTSPRTSRPPSPRASFAFSLSTSPTTSRPASRSGSRSGRATPALSRGSSFEHSAITIKASRPSLSTASSSHSIRSSLKGKSKEVAGRDYESSETGRSTKASGAKALGLSRPTASSMNKATRRVVSQSSGHRVSTIANHFNKLSRDNERERQRKLTLFRGKRARPVAVAHPTIQVFDNVKDAAKEDSDEDDGRSSDGADDEDDDEHEEDSDGEDDGKGSRSRRSSPERRARLEPSTTSTKESFTYDATAPAISMADVLARPTLETLVAPDEPTAALKMEEVPKVEVSEVDATSEADAPSVPPSPLLNEGFATLPRMSEGESSGNERGSIIKAISNLWAYRGGDFTPLEYPLAAGEHIFADNPILVREDEPSSILAFALSSKAYRSKVEEQSTAVPSRAVLDRSETFMPDEVQPVDRSSNWGVVDIAQEGTDVEDTLRKPEAKHFRLQFEEGTTTFFCKIFFAEQFDALRRNCGCSSQFIESLARCVKWESSGGRSKVDFLKTKDDRFIVKEISRLEMDALLRFAPAYFEYMSKAIFHGLPTILAKIFGFYRIGFRNPATGKVMRLDVLVMENLFYERQLTQIFDLKGSTRNRHVQVTKERPNEVLMDENLVEISLLNPLYVREESKRFLKAAIFNDSLFLSNLNVMDYSLVVGVDSVKQELVVGIVDFIRTYTWDKRLESWVKDTAFLGGGSSKPGGPTIITPKQYKHRFREAMDGYFLLSPDAWVSPSSFIPVSTQPPKEEKETYAGATTEAAP